MMKNAINIVVCVVIILTISSCDFFSEKPSTQDSVGSAATVEGISKEIKGKIAAQDTLMNALVLKVDTLAQALSQAQKENAELKVQIEKLESPKNIWAYISIGAIVLGLIALIVSLLRHKGIKENRAKEIVNECLDDSHRIKVLQVNVNNLLSSQRNNKVSNTSSSYAPNSDCRLRQLENQMAQVIETINKITPLASQPVSTRQNPTRSREGNEYQKVGYAKVDTDIYFTTILESNQEGCVFKLTFTSQTKGKFNIIALDKIQSRNDWQKKVECSGVSIKEATDFRLEDEGVCEKIDENTWKVTKPLKIRLIK